MNDQNTGGTLQGGERVLLGESGLSVSPVCFGTWQLSPRFWGKQPEDQILAAMRVARDEGGINFFDTADAYGDGHSESVLGNFISESRRDELVITTKVFNHYNPDASRYPDLSPAHIIERCEASLKRLKIETIDLYLLHFTDPLSPLSEVALTLERLREQGKIRCYGVSNHNVEQLRAARCFGSYSVIQPPYNLLEPGIEADLLPYCQTENVGVMVYSPMHKGLLSGKYTGTETFDDFRQHHPDFQGERFQMLAQTVQDFKTMADRYGLSVYQLVLAATLMHPAIQVAVVGIKTPEQIREAAGAMGQKIDRSDYFAIRSALAGGVHGRIRDASGKTK